MTNAEARFNNSLRPRKPEGSLGWTAQDSHLSSHTASELCFKLVPNCSCISTEAANFKLVASCTCIGTEAADFRPVANCMCIST